MTKHILAIAILLTGCSVSVDEFDYGVKACSTHEGLDYMKPVLGSDWYSAYCKDGTVVMGHRKQT